MLSLVQKNYLKIMKFNCNLNYEIIPKSNFLHHYVTSYSQNTFLWLSGKHSNIKWLKPTTKQTAILRIITFCFTVRLGMQIPMLKIILKKKKMHGH